MMCKMSLSLILTSHCQSDLIPIIKTITHYFTLFHLGFVFFKAKPFFAGFRVIRAGFRIEFRKAIILIIFDVH
jgi:hypothetical protein